MDLSTSNGGCVFQFTFVKHNSTFFLVDGHVIIILPIPYNLPGLLELLVSCTYDGNVVRISKHVISLTIQRVQEVINEHREQRRADYASLDNSLVDKRLFITVEHFRLAVEPFDGVA